jgi:hypothetical protein
MRTPHLIGALLGSHERHARAGVHAVVEAVVVQVPVVAGDAAGLGGRDTGRGVQRDRDALGGLVRPARIGAGAGDHGEVAVGRDELFAADRVDRDRGRVGARIREDRTIDQAAGWVLVALHRGVHAFDAALARRDGVVDDRAQGDLVLGHAAEGDGRRRRWGAPNGVDGQRGVGRRPAVVSRRDFEAQLAALGHPRRGGGGRRVQRILDAERQVRGLTHGARAGAGEVRRAEHDPRRATVDGRHHAVLRRAVRRLGGELEDLIRGVHDGQRRHAQRNGLGHAGQGRHVNLAQHLEAAYAENERDGVAVSLADVGFDDDVRRQHRRIDAGLGRLGRTPGPEATLGRGRGDRDGGRRPRRERPREGQRCGEGEQALHRRGSFTGRSRRCSG